MTRNNELAEAVRRSLERYFRDMDGEKPTAIYDMVLKNIERPLIERPQAERHRHLNHCRQRGASSSNRS